MMQNIKQNLNRKLRWIICITVVILTLGIGSYLYIATADDANTVGPVTLESLDYNTMEITLNTNGNVVIYYSTNKKTWYEADATITSSKKDDKQIHTILYDISWLAYGKTVYFRGNIDKTTCMVKLPASNKKLKVKFSKVDGTFDFDNTDGAEIIRWRKTTDYNWHYVWLDSQKADTTISSSSIGDDETYYKKYGEIGAVQSMQNFVNEVRTLRAKAVKLLFQTVPIIWTNGNEGMPPSKEVKVSIPALKAAPNIKVNVKKLTVNTTVKQQWSVSHSALDTDWTNCSKTMKISELASKAAIGETDQTIYFRLAATSSVGASKIATLAVPARAEAPEAPISVNMITPASIKKKASANIQFSNVPSEGYEYCIIKAGALDESRAAWKTIKTSKTLKFNQNRLPAGSVIYVRVKGVAQNINKKIDLKLPSLCYSVTIPTYPVYSEQ